MSAGAVRAVIGFVSLLVKTTSTSRNDYKCIFECNHSFSGSVCITLRKNGFVGKGGENSVNTSRLIERFLLETYLIRIKQAKD